MLHTAVDVLSSVAVVMEIDTGDEDSFTSSSMVVLIDLDEEENEEEEWKQPTEGIRRGLHFPHLSKLRLHILNVTETA